MPGCEKLPTSPVIAPFGQAESSFDFDNKILLEGLAGTPVHRRNNSPRATLVMKAGGLNRQI
jgi:hypothetical protein